MRQSPLTEQRRAWSSSKVALSLLTLSSAVAITACQPQSSGGGDRRNQYGSRAQCEADYSPKECEPQARSGGGFFFLGPIYAGNWGQRGAGAFANGGGPGRAALASGTGIVAQPTQTAKGGFGATGRSYSNRGG
jgi:hypothetical protein